MTGTVGLRTRGRRLVGLPLVIVCAAIAATQASWAVIVPVLPDYVGRFDVGAAGVGTVVALFGVGRLLANIPTGLALRRADPRVLLFGAMAGVVLSLVATGFVTSLAQLLVLRLITGLAGGVAITSGMTLVALLSSTETRGLSMSLLQTMQLTGGALGMAVGGAVYTAWGDTAPFLVCGGIGGAVILAGAPLLFRRPRPDLGRTAAGTDRSGPERRLLADRSFVAVCSVVFAVFFHRFGGVQAILPLVGYTLVGLTVAQYGLVAGLVSVLGLVAAVPIGIASDRLGRKTVMIAGLVLAGLGLPLMIIDAGPWWFVGLTVITGLAATACAPVQAAYVADLAGSSPGLAVGVSRSWGDLAGILGPVTLGLTADLFGLRVAVVVLAVVLILPVPLVALLARETVPRRSRGAA